MTSPSSSHSLHSPNGVGEGWEVPHRPGQLPKSPPPYLCTQCPPGYGVIIPCLVESNTLVNDTVCELCPRGTFSKEFSAEKLCNLCSECPTGFYEQTPCMAMQDVRCRSCVGNSNGAFGNEDYFLKCENTSVRPPPREDSSESSGEEGEAAEAVPTTNVFTNLKNILDGSGQAEEDREKKLPEEFIPVSTQKPLTSRREENTTGR